MKGAAVLLDTRKSTHASKVTTFGVGGPISQFYEPDSFEELVVLLQRIEESGERALFLGNGSNLIVRDEGIHVPVLRLGRTFGSFYLARREDRGDEGFPVKLTSQSAPHVFAFASMSLMSLSRQTAALGLSGLEFAAGIPGSVGGAVRMNAGAHGEEIGKVVSEVYSLTRSGRLVVRENVSFSYRSTDIPEDELIVGTLFTLSPGDARAITARRTECLDYRKRTQPLTLPSAGSVFRNGSRPAGELLEKSGLKGFRRGGVMFSELHANWLVRVEEHASAEDALALIELGSERVFENFGEKLIPEIVCW